MTEFASSILKRPGAKIVAVSEYTDREQNSTGYFWHQAINHLRDAGIPVHTASYTRKMAPRVRSSVLLRVCLKLYISLRLIMSVARSARSGDVVFSGSNPEILLPMLVLLKPLLRFKLCVLVHDVFPDNLLPAGLLQSKQKSYLILLSFFGWVYRRFDSIVVIGRDMKKLVDSKVGNERSIFIPNWVDHKEIVPCDRYCSEILNSLGWQNHIVFQFYGNMGRLQGLEGLLRGLEKVRKENSAFLFVGNGIMQPEIERFCARNSRRYFLRPQGNFDRNAILGSCDVSIVCLKAGMLGLGVPSKGYFSLAADRPLLAIVDEGSELALMIRDHRVGWVCAPNDPDQIAATIDEICSKPIEIASGHCRRLMETEFSSDAALDKLTNLILAMLE